MQYDATYEDVFPDRADATRAERRLPDFIAFCATCFICLAPVSYALSHFEPGERLLWLGADITAVLYILQNRDRLRDSLFANPYLTAWPALAILSSLWSLTPGISAYHGFQLFLTILIGYSLQIYFGLYRTVKIIFWALVFAQILSVLAVFGAPRVAMGTGREWLGIYTHKNVLGGMMALSMICSANLYCQGYRRVVTAGAFMSALLLLLMSRSATSLVAAMAGLLPIAFMFIWVRGKQVIGFVCGLAIAASGIAVAIVTTFGDSIAASFLDDLGKDRTMTGRTVLWQFGYDQLWREPILGVGFKAYWESPLTTAEYLRFVINQRLWFFHNNFFDVGVAFGAVGLTVLALGLAVSFKRAWMVAATSHHYIAAFPIMFCCYIAVMMNFENVLFQNHSIQQMILAAVIPLLGHATPTDLPADARRDAR